MEGTIVSDGDPVPFASVLIQVLDSVQTTDASGNYSISNLPEGKYTVIASSLGFISDKEVSVTGGSKASLDFILEKDVAMINEVVVSGTMKEVSKLESAVPVEVYSPRFFKANPTPSVYEALQIVNGVRPQINCSVCNTGDIHVNGLEGPYTMVLIDGMPIVSGLSTVYGLNGIPQSLIERVEVVKGPASTLYGSEAVGGLINIITKNTSNSPFLSVDILALVGELNADVAAGFH